MELTEAQIISRIAAASGASRDDVVIGIGDDAAVLVPPPGFSLVAALDTLVAGRHFPAGMAAADIGYRALAVNLSDLAAMGAVPAWALVSLTLESAEADWIDAFASGLAGLAAMYDVAIVGGDTVGGPLAVSVQVTGFVAPDAVLTRGGARAGEVLYVSGTPGDAAAGLAMLLGKIDASAEAAAYLRGRFCRPAPRIAVGRGLVGIATAAIDISDGLVTDAQRLADASGCGIEIDVERVPLSPSLAACCDGSAAERFALAGGDDYELLFSVPPACAAAVAALAVSSGVPLTPIGRLLRGSGVSCLRNDQRVEPPAPYAHSFASV